MVSFKFSFCTIIRSTRRLKLITECIIAAHQPHIIKAITSAIITFICYKIQRTIKCFLLLCKMIICDRLYILASRSLYTYSSAWCVLWNSFFLFLFETFSVIWIRIILLDSSFKADYKTIHWFKYAGCHVKKVLWFKQWKDSERIAVFPCATWTYSHDC